jgi:hypothetical protein
MNNLKKAIIGFGLASAIIGGGTLLITDEPVQPIVCPKENIRLELRDSGGMKTDEECLTQEGYKALKDSLYAEFESKKDLKGKKKDYDFDINSRDLLMAVINRELTDKKITLNGLTKEKIRDELVKLLKSN